MRKWLAVNLMWLANRITQGVLRWNDIWIIKCSYCGGRGCVECKNKGFIAVNVKGIFK